jgi:hypothetical protein
MTEASSVLHSRVDELGRAAIGRALHDPDAPIPADARAVTDLALHVLDVILDRSQLGRGWAYCGRQHLGEEVARRWPTEYRGALRAAWCVRHVGRALALLAAADLTQARWGPFKRPKWRTLSATLRDELARLAGRRAKRGPRSRAGWKQREAKEPEQPAGTPVPMFECECGWRGRGDSCAVNRTHTRAPP